MKIHEYQAKEILRRFGVATPRGRVTEDADEAARICEEVGGRCVVKAQIHAGGRGKGGGVKLANSPEEAREKARQILGMQLVTPQTGPEGQIVRKVLVEEALAIASELYVSVTLDRRLAKPIVMASASGGMDIEEVAAHDPSAILREPVDPHLGLLPFQGRSIVKGLKLGGKTAREAAKLLEGLVAAYLATDASLAEVNPLLITADGSVLALDAKMNFDDNALFRRPDVAALRDLGEENPMEVEAGKYGLNYIKLDGTIGCMVNGAGLAMATMDLVKRAGGEPANFLDIGGGARAEKVAAAMRLILSDPKVNAILVNIFGGITRGDEVARGLIEARAQQTRDVPMVVRIVGTNAAEAGVLLREARFETADSLDDAAAKAVAAARGAAA
ncbi:MAG TPA: ADP-forming succinate--CoA ligase subunit beta [Thermoanaerobaculia bacterium]|nr:ADP-forming succinate--CoA ligase subunit beta [Thermoanaerobaculia bacterium]